MSKIHKLGIFWWQQKCWFVCLSRFYGSTEIVETETPIIIVAALKMR